MIEFRVLGPKTGPERRAGYRTNFPPTAPGGETRGADGAVEHGATMRGKEVG